MNIEHAQLSMNIFDAGILGVFCLSAVVAFFRGFLREVLSLVAWVGAGVITLYLFPQSTQFLTNHVHVKNEHVAAGAAALGTYMAALITISLFNSILIRYLKTGTEVGMIDNLLGLIFGSIRGAFIVSLAFLIMSGVVMPKDKDESKVPVWLKTSVTRPYLQKGADIVVKLAPRYLSDVENLLKKQKANQQNPASEEGAPVDDVTISPQDGTEDINASKANTRKALDSLINATNPPQEGTVNDRQ